MNNLSNNDKHILQGQRVNLIAKVKSLRRSFFNTEVPTQYTQNLLDLEEWLGNRLAATAKELDESNY